MSYRVALGNLDLATYEITVGDVTDLAGKRAIIVQSHAKALEVIGLVTNIDDTFTSWIDVETSRPLRWFVDEFAPKSTNKERTEALMYERAGDTLPIQFSLNDEPPTAEPQKVSLPDVWDYNAFLIALRGWEAPPGSTLTAEVLRSRYLWNVTVTIRGRDKIITEHGILPALRFDAHTYKLRRDGTRDTDAPARDLSIWISDDDDRVPLRSTGRTDYGQVTMTLVEYTPGDGERLRR